MTPPPSAGSESEFLPPPRPGATAPVRWKDFELSPFQIQAVEAIRAGKNLLVCAPTGAGKTLVAEVAIEDAVRRGRRCIYTAPIKALSNQKYRDFRDDPAVEVGLMTGDVTINPSAQVLIMTTEILRNSIFEAPERLHDVDYVIFDEVHFLDDPERGSVWEESLIFAPSNVRFICLSATIANGPELGDWLDEIREEPLALIRSSERPVPLTHFLFSAREGIFPVQRLGRVRKRLGHAPRSSFPNANSASRRGARDGSRRTGRGPRMFEFEQPPDSAALLDELDQRGLLPALVFTFSRRDTERLARANAGRRLLAPAEEQRMESLQRELVELFQLKPAELESELLTNARRGVSHHHAGMLPVHKELVERMFTSGLLKLLFTTETFALGINMPAHSVIFHSLRKFDGVSFDYLRTRDFLQMAGRAGRQGIDEEGFVYAQLSQRDLYEAPIDRLVRGKPEPVQSRFKLSYSSLLNLVSRLGRERVGEAWEKSFNEFQHRGGSERARARNRSEKRRAVTRQLDFLEARGYLDGDVPTARGKMAMSINGYELQVTELLFRGALENLPPKALAIVFVGLIFEQRRRGAPVRVSSHLFGGVRRHVDSVLGRLARQVREAGIPSSPKEADWSLSPAVAAWVDGASFEELEDATEVPAGDVCRTFRMALQLMRQVLRAIDPAWDLGPLLREAMGLVDRDEIDARHQLELG